MTYEQGFSQGEADAWRERMAGLPMRDFDAPKTPVQRGYVAGYTPRSVNWWHVQQPVLRPEELVIR